MIEIRELEIPSSVGGDGWTDFSAAMGVHFGNEALSYGTDELALTPAEALSPLLDQENVPTRIFVARDGARIVGAARYEIEPGDDPQTAWLMIDVLPGVRRSGNRVGARRTPRGRRRDGRHPQSHRVRGVTLRPRRTHPRAHRVGLRAARQPGGAIPARPRIPARAGRSRQSSRTARRGRRRATRPPCGNPAPNTGCTGGSIRHPTHGARRWRRCANS